MKGFLHSHSCLGSPSLTRSLHPFVTPNLGLYTYSNGLSLLPKLVIIYGSL